MASKIWLNIRNQEHIKEAVFANYPGKRRHGFLNDQAIIAKGNIIEGIEAKE